MEEYYRVLQVDPSAEPEVIEAAWRRLAQLYHPDGARPDPDRMKAINVAHDVLKDPERRAAHDRDGERRRTDAAQVWSPSTRRARRVRRDIRGRNRQIAWPIAYALAWFVGGVLWSNFAAAWAPSQPWADLEQVGPSAVVGYVFGCGVIGSIDLTYLCRRSGEDLPLLGCVGVLIISPLVLAAGCVVAPIRAVVAAVSWVGGLVEGRRVRRNAN